MIRYQTDLKRLQTIESYGEIRGQTDDGGLRSPTTMPEAVGNKHKTEILSSELATYALHLIQRY